MTVRALLFALAIVVTGVSFTVVSTAAQANGLRIDDNG